MGILSFCWERDLRCPNLSLGRGKERTLRLVLGRGLVSGAGARIHDEGLLLIMLS